jgi:hypothetical protein
LPLTVAVVACLTAQKAPRAVAASAPAIPLATGSAVHTSGASNPIAIQARHAPPRRIVPLLRNLAMRQVSAPAVCYGMCWIAGSLRR